MFFDFLQVCRDETSTKLECNENTLQTGKDFKDLAYR